MITCLEETSSKVFVCLPKILTLEFADKSDEETLIGEFHDFYTVLNEASNVFSDAWQKTRYIKNNELAEETRKLLIMLRTLISDFLLLGVDVSLLPSLNVAEAGDESVSIEWIFKNFRIGFSIDPCITESSWFLVSNANMGNVNASGYMRDISSKQSKYIMTWLLSYALTNG